MSTADHVTCCCAETLADIERLTQERDDATIITALREGWTTTMAEVVPDEVRRLAIGGNAG